MHANANNIPGAFRLQISIVTLVDAAFELFNNLQKGDQNDAGGLCVFGSIAKSIVSKLGKMVTAHAVLIRFSDINDARYNRSCFK